MSTQPLPVIVPNAVVTIQLFDRNQQPASLVDVNGDLPTDEALRRALSAVYAYLSRHVLGNAPRDPAAGQ